MARAIAVAMVMLSVAAGALEAQEGPTGAVFRIGVGPSVAANGPQIKKNSVMAVRTEGCADAGAASITGTAEGLVGHERQSFPLTLRAAGSPGVYGVEGRWPTQGVWVLSFSGSCGRSQAGTVVPLRAGEFIREGIVFLTHPPAPGDVDASLKTLAAAGTAR